MVECLGLGYKPTGRSRVSQSYLTGTQWLFGSLDALVRNHFSRLRHLPASYHNQQQCIPSPAVRPGDTHVLG